MMNFCPGEVWILVINLRENSYPSVEIVHASFAVDFGNHIDILYFLSEK